MFKLKTPKQKNSLMSWKELPLGGVIEEAGCSQKYNTGDWRVKRPIVDKVKCINCLTCWLYCPDMAIKVKNEKLIEPDLEHCKGCGLCANVCPVKCIKMVSESDFK